MKKTVICYKTLRPMIINEGTEYEKRVSTFLFCYCDTIDLERAKSICNLLNTQKPSKLWNGREINWDEIEYFFADEQEEMCG